MSPKGILFLSQNYSCCFKMLTNLKPFGFTSNPTFKDFASSKYDIEKPMTRINSALSKINPNCI